MSKIDVLNDGNIWVLSLKIVLRAIFFTIIALLLLTCFVAYGNIPDAAVSLCVKAATVISMFSAGFMTARKRRKSGIVSGVIAGSIYVLIMILAAFAVCGGAEPGGETLSMYLLCVICSIIGGIFGVNTKKKIKDRR